MLIRPLPLDAIHHAGPSRRHLGEGDGVAQRIAQSLHHRPGDAGERVLHRQHLRQHDQARARTIAFAARLLHGVAGIDQRPQVPVDAGLGRSERGGDLGDAGDLLLGEMLEDFEDELNRLHARGRFGLC